MTEQQENALNHLLEMVQSLDASAACDGANDCHPSIGTERIYDSLAIALRQALTAPTLPMVALLSDDQLDTFAEQIRAAERERCAAIAEQMTAHSRKIRAALNGVVAPDCPVAAAIRNL